MGRADVSLHFAGAVSGDASPWKVLIADDEPEVHTVTRLVLGSFRFDDVDLRNNDLVRIYDVVIPYSDGLMATDELLRDMLIQPEFQKEMGTAELHYKLGKYCAEYERKHKLKDVSVLAAAYRAGMSLIKATISASTPTS